MATNSNGCLAKSEHLRFSELVYNVLKHYSGSVLSTETVEGLLKSERDNDGTFFCSNASNLKGYPTYPLYKRLSKNLYDWMKSGKSELCCDTRNPELLSECRNEKEKQAVQNFVDCKLQLVSATEEVSTKKVLILEILEKLKMRGILDLLGMKQTVGSVEIFPPPLSNLLESFEQKYKPKATLSCGGRALSKHCHRDSTSQWWGISTGSEGAKNEHAVEVLMKILDNTAWINIHQLPHEVRVLEVRNQLGYGARWSCNGMTFRGFLEPQMSDGHSIGWKH